MKRIAAVFLILSLVFCLTSCGKTKNEAYMEADHYYDGGSVSDVFMTNENHSAAVKTDGNPHYGLIMTYSAYLELETKQFDECEQKLLAAVAAAGGYISSQETTGGYSASGDYYSVKRTSLTVKIPADKLDSFLAGAEGYANVTSLSKTSDDITSGYLDTQARLASLESQRDRLMELMEKAESLTELLEIEDRLSYVIYEIESYTSQMNTYKELAAFSKVTIQLREVSTYTAPHTSFLSRLWKSVVEGWTDFLENIGDLFLGIVYLFPTLLLMGVVLFAVVRLIRKKKAKNSGTSKE